jgi:4-hydroxy-tetrahydrodipicolinate synthase
MLDALKADDTPRAMKVWARIKPFEDLRARGNHANNVPVVKEALAQLGECERTVRPPISDLAESEREQVSAILQEWGLLGTGERA